VFVNLQNQVSFSQWNFEFGNVDGQSRKAFVFGQPLLSDDLVPQNPLSVSLNQVSMVDSVHMLPDFQQSFDVSSLELSKLPFRIDDWVLVDGVVAGNFSINSTTYHCQNDPLMLNRSIVSYYPSGDPNSASSNEYLLFSSSPTLHDGNMYFCMAHVVLSLAGTPGTNDWDLRASTKAVRVVMIPSNAAPPWSDPSPDVYRIVAEAFQNAWSCASANIDNGHFIGVRKVLAASFHSNSMFQVPIAVSPGPGHEVDQNVLVRCRADSSLESPVMFAYAVSINRTHSCF